MWSGYYRVIDSPKFTTRLRPRKSGLLFFVQDATNTRPSHIFYIREETDTRLNCLLARPRLDQEYQRFFTRPRQEPTFDEEKD